MRAIRRFTVRTVLPEGLASLGELVTNLRWSWHPPTRDLFARIDPDVWEAVGQDPVRLLGEVSRERLVALAADQDFLRHLNEASHDLRDYLNGKRWYQELTGDVPAAIGYFSPEFGVTSVLPQYSGGLGILAGDHLKAASDLGVPIVGVGLLYRHGYFRQSLTREGWQLERYPLVDPDGMPISMLREADGTPARVKVGLPGGRTLAAYVWVAQVGRVPLLMLDSDVEDNRPAERNVTDRLYGGGTEHRLLQEMLLGIGGVRALRAYSRITGAPAPEVFHTNEGHAGFLGLERIRELTESAGLDFDVALEAVRAGTVFTTHTPVPAGIDRFPRELIAQHFGGDNADPGVPVDRILELGTENVEGGDPAVFNMAFMGLRLAQRANGVSRLHGHVSRHMFAGLWSAFDEAEVPITSITNGVHAPTWTPREMPGSRAADQLLWATKRVFRERLVADARRRVRESLRQRGVPDADLGWVDSLLDPDVLTIGFARRVPSYKRLTLMLRDPDRLKAILLDPQRPVQLVIAGKSHPADDGGKLLIQELVRFADDDEVRHRIVFLPDYDIAMAQILYPGCDVWLNNPLRPYEACGTSGMKAALSGGLNLSIRDGWWDEWYDGENGWAIPSAEGVADPNRRDDIEASSLYDLIETSVVPRFYDRSGDDPQQQVPVRWLEMVRHTLATLGPKVLASRMVQDYVEQLYRPAARSGRALDGDGYAAAKDLAAWKRQVRDLWPGVRVEHVESTVDSSGAEAGTSFGVRAYVSLGALRPEDVVVELLHGRVDERDELRDPVRLALPLAESFEAGRYAFEGDVPLDRTGPFGYTVRVLPQHPQLASIAELGLVALPVPPPEIVDGAPLR